MNPLTEMSAPTRRNVPSQPLSQAVPLAPQTTKATAESDADARLRDRDASPSRKSPAFGGMKRRGSNMRAGAIGGLRKREWWILAGITLLGVAVRFYRLGWPTSVVYVSAASFLLESRAD